MSRRILTMMAWGLGGLVVALTLTLGAFAIAGQEISEPASAPVFSSSPSPEPSTAGERNDRESPSPAGGGAGLDDDGTDDDDDADDD